jgi:LacI family transcriptional regulator/LacI family repressor for deo operon, udp, cdd, tsx, nupC, and nupG
MATLADVAALAGVSKATASRVLSRPELVAPDTASKVLEAARKLSFVPNRAARQLARGRTGIVAIVVPALDNSYLTPIIAGAQARAGEADLQVAVAVYPLSEISELTAFEQLSHQVDGFVMIAPRCSEEVIRAAGGYKPTVLVDREVVGMASVVADTATAFGTVVTHFVDAGHERIVYLGGPDGSWQDTQRTIAVADAARGRAELTVLGPLPPSFAAGVRATELVVASGATAAVPYATDIAIGLMFMLRPDERRHPVAVSAARMIVESLGLRGVPGIDVDGDNLGRVAMDRLIEASSSPTGTLAESTVRLPVSVHSGAFSQ